MVPRRCTAAKHRSRPRQAGVQARPPVHHAAGAALAALRDSPERPSRGPGFTPELGYRADPASLDSYFAPRPLEQ